MFDAETVLAADPGGLNPAQLTLLLTAATRWRDELQAKIVATLAEGERTGAFVATGQASTADWFAHATGVTPAEARRLARVARHLTSLPAFAAALDAGRLSPCQLETLLRPMHNPRVRSGFRRDQDEILARALTLEPDQYALYALKVEAVYDQDGRRPKDEADDTRGHMTQNDVTGRWRLDVDFDPIDGAAFDAELNAIMGQLRNSGTFEADDGELRTSRLCGAALAEMAARAAAHPKRNPEAPTATIIVPIDALDGDGLATIEGGPLSPRQLEGLLCDSVLTTLIVSSDGAILRMSSPERTATKEQRHHLALRDGGCVFPGCHAKPGRCHAHHIHHWHLGGPTQADNMCLTCTRHHRLIHKGVWDIRLLPSGDAEWTHQATGRTEVRRRHQPWLVTAA